ncbi:glycoside hydrolase family 5 protein [Methylicorpusculum oleiharenae]|uniref:glycoside hydrolase family 5 protein n=1 Tax=Methylicorpusculum oleiharenae TaxID=1338687 RepID=UPI00135A2C0C|nr:cellulase family glycosylhydrolase [Methylicorpusculum oleiharenae]MCD2452305.1 glycoside hydrolase family 5 protein [Methylicorpusculum oleiharenae]
MKLKSDFLSILPRIPVLLSTLIILSPLCCFASDFLKVDGPDIRDNYGEGKNVHLYGTNLGGWRGHEPWMSPLTGASNEWDARNILTDRFGKDAVWELYNAYWDSWITEIDFKNIAEAGLNCIRLPVYAFNHMDDEGNWRLDDTGAIDLSRIEWTVNKALEYGLYTILDLHGAPGSQNGAHHSGRQNGPLLYSTPLYQNQLIEFWETLATRFKDNAAVAGYDLINEPSETFPGRMGSEVVNLYDSLYQAIRAIDPDHIIFMEAIWWWDTLPNPQEKNWENVVYSLHYYQWQNNEDFTVMKNAVDGWIQEAQNWGSKYNVPHFIGEFTLFANADSWDYGLQQFTETGSHWTTWTYKVMGRNNWGMYNTEAQNSNVADIASDDLNTIKNKWSQWNTPEYFSPNPTVINAMRKATLGRDLKRPTEAFTAKSEKLAENSGDVAEPIAAFD